MPAPEAESERAGESKADIPERYERAESEKAAVSEETAIFMPAPEAESENAGELDCARPDL